MKKLLKLALIALAVLTVISAGALAASAAEAWDGSIASGYASGDGSEETPYIIETAEQLAYLSNRVANGVGYSGKFISLEADILLNDISDYADWETTAPDNVWSPIGVKDKPFVGTFEGNGHTISGLYLNAETEYQGLFGYISAGKIKNVAMKYTFIKCGTPVYGTVKYEHNKDGWTDDVIQGGTVVHSAMYIGSVVGYSATNSLVTGCSAEGSVTAICRVGGVVGYSIGAVNKCVNKATVTANSGVGGIVGCASGLVSECINLGDISGTNYIGGIGGEIALNTVTNCYNSGSVTAKDTGGGIAGYCSSSAALCYTNGALTIENMGAAIVGFLSSATGSVTNCYYKSSTAEYVYNSGNPESGKTDGADGLTNSRMRKAENFPAFDFDTTWACVFGTAPTLVWYKNTIAAEKIAPQFSLSGAAIRLEGVQGLRMSANMLNSLKELTVETDGFEVVEYGILAKAASTSEALEYFDNGESMYTQSGLVAKSASYKIDPDSREVANDVYLSRDTENTKFSSVLVGFPADKASYSANFEYRGYIALYDGANYSYYYTDSDTTSIYSVANTLLDRDYAGDVNGAPSFIQGIINTVTAE